MNIIQQNEYYKLVLKNIKKIISNKFAKYPHIAQKII